MIESCIPKRARLLIAQQRMKYSDLKVALYTAEAALNEDTEAYTPDHEVEGPGYTKGGVLLGTAEVVQGEKITLNLPKQATWACASVKADGCIVYNGTAVLAVCAFPSPVTSTNDEFKVEFPDSLMEF